MRNEGVWMQTTNESIPLARFSLRENHIYLHVYLCICSCYIGIHNVWLYIKDAFSFCNLQVQCGTPRGLNVNKLNESANSNTIRANMLSIYLYIYIYIYMYIYIYIYIYIYLKRERARERERERYNALLFCNLQVQCGTPRGLDAITFARQMGHAGDAAVTALTVDSQMHGMYIYMFQQPILLYRLYIHRRCISVYIYVSR